MEQSGGTQGERGLAGGDRVFLLDHPSVRGCWVGHRGFAVCGAKEEGYKAGPQDKHKGARGYTSKVGEQASREAGTLGAPC